MAARIRKIKHDDNTREKIRAAQLINRLQSFIDGELELSAQQVKAIEILLKKTLPDLASVEQTGEVDNKVTIKWAD